MKRKATKACCTILLGSLLLLLHTANLQAQSPQSFSHVSYRFQGAQYMISDLSSVYTSGLGEFTMSLWYKYEGPVLQPGESAVLFSNVEEYPYATRIDILTIAGNMYIAGIARLADGSFVGSNGRRVEPDGRWHHVAFVVWQANNTVNTKLYLDGQWDHVTGQSPGSSLPVPWPVCWMVGAQADANGMPENYFNGKIDEISFWSTALDADEVQLVYNSGVPNDLSVIPVTPHWLHLWLHDDFFDQTMPSRTYTSAGVTLSDDVPEAADSTPPTAPHELKATFVRQRQITIQWLPSLDNVAVVGYHLKIQSEEAGGGWVEESDLEADSFAETEHFTYTFFDLDPATAYAISVSAYDESGNMSEPASLRVTTPFF